jgi:hypothetical protein
MSLRGVRLGGRRLLFCARSRLRNPLAVINIKKGARLLRSARNDTKTLLGYPIRLWQTTKQSTRAR